MTLPAFARLLPEGKIKNPIRKFAVRKVEQLKHTIILNLKNNI